MKRSVPLILVLVLALAGCGGGSSTSTRKATAPNAPAGSKVTTCQGGIRAADIDCGSAIEAKQRWSRKKACAPSGSRSSCSIGDYRCQAVKIDSGVSVSCAEPGGDVTFLAKRAG